MPETTNAVRQARAAGQSIWLDSISREMIQTGELERFVGIGVSGVTSNPTIFDAAIASGASYDDAIVRYLDEGGDAARVFEGLAVEDIRDAADILRPVHEDSDGEDGFVSIEVSPLLARDTAGTIEEAHRLFSRIDRPNVMIKVPGTPEGMPAIHRLISEGINVNVTLLFAISAYRQAAQAYLDGQRDYVSAGGASPERIASVASFFVSRVDGVIDKLLEGQPDSVEAAELAGKAGIANARLAYRAFQEIFSADRFQEFASRGVQVQRPLWGSTSTKNPEYRDVMYLESLIGPHTVNTVPPTTLSAFLEHGEVSETVTHGVEEAESQFVKLSEFGIEIDRVTSELLTAGVDAFAVSYHSVLQRIEDKRALLRRATAARGRARLGASQPVSREALDRASDERLVERIWEKDAGLWAEPSPGAATAQERLGWLTLPGAIGEVADRARTVAAELRAEGYEHAVLLGMGGSSLSPEVTRAVVGRGPKGLSFRLLDSTVPGQITNIEREIDVRKTVFVVSSKSGTTIEPLALYRYFRGRLEAGGEAEPDSHFIAVTDQGTPLEALAGDAGFRAVFTAPPDVGGRFSALTAFGIVPAALMDADIDALAAAAATMAEACRASSSLNPGLSLGALTGSLAAAGRDKVTLVVSPELDYLGLWVEQLLAESTGKAGTGMTPVWRESFYDPGVYGDDRQFVYVRLQGGDNDEADAHAARLEQAGLPVVRLEMADRTALWAEFYRWEFSIPVAATYLGVYPFDEPNVDLAKQMAREALADPKATTASPTDDVGAALSGLLGTRRDRDFLAIGAFLPESEGLTDAFCALRDAVGAKSGLAISFGYGPRYLHSTGQLHKGGPDSTMVLVIVSDDGPELSIPGEKHTFGALASAQAAGEAAALMSVGRRTAFVKMSGDYEGAVRRLTSSLGH